MKTIDTEILDKIIQKFLQENIKSLKILAEQTGSADDFGGDADKSAWVNPSAENPDVQEIMKANLQGMTFDNSDTILSDTIKRIATKPAGEYMAPEEFNLWDAVFSNWITTTIIGVIAWKYLGGKSFVKGLVKEMPVIGELAKYMSSKVKEATKNAINEKPGLTQYAKTRIWYLMNKETGIAFTEGTYKKFLNVIDDLLDKKIIDERQHTAIEAEFNETAIKNLQRQVKIEYVKDLENQVKSGNIDLKTWKDITSKIGISGSEAVKRITRELEHFAGAEKGLSVAVVRTKGLADLKQITIPINSFTALKKMTQQQFNQIITSSEYFKTNPLSQQLFNEILDSINKAGSKISMPDYTIFPTPQIFKMHVTNPKSPYNSYFKDTWIAKETADKLYQPGQYTFSYKNLSEASYKVYRFIWSMEHTKIK